MVDTRFSVSVQIMMTLAVHSDELLNSDFLSKVLKTNPTFIRKIVSNLVEAGLVESFRGKGGGVKIATPPESINSYKTARTNVLINMVVQLKTAHDS